MKIPSPSVNASSTSTTKTPEKAKPSSNAITPVSKTASPATTQPSTAGELPKDSSTQLQQINCDALGRVRLKIEDEAYYHGFMTRQEIRKVEAENGFALILTTFHNDKHHHFIFKRTRQQRLYWLSQFAFKSPNDLIQYHYRNRIAISDSGFKLKKPFFKQDWELNHEQVEKKNQLGAGAFGEVYDGLLQTSLFAPRLPVAIKTLHASTAADINGDEKFKFLKEANLMLPLKHENIVKLYGVCAAKEPIQIVMELAEGGSLISKLQSRIPPTMNEKANFVFGAAKGMGYLEMKSVIHRDLAARNCLLDKRNQVKISDFGLSMLGNEYRDKRLKNVPTRWMAPESLKRGIYSSKSDVYSFAVLMYEIYSDGEKPYEGVEDKFVKKLILEKKIHLTIPANAIPDYMENLRIRCGQYNPEGRPTFKEAVSLVSEMPGIIHPPPPSWWKRTKEKLRSWTMKKPPT